MLKAIGDENRLLILDMLKDGEKCACKLLERLGISQPTLEDPLRIRPCQWAQGGQMGTLFD